MAPNERSERTEIVENLERSRQEFLAAVAGLTESQAKVRPDPERWSVLDCVEHVATVEERFLGWLEKAEKLDAPRVDKEKEAGLMARVPDRSTRVKAPEAVVPTGRFTTLGASARAIQRRTHAQHSVRRRSLGRSLLPGGRASALRADEWRRVSDYHRGPLRGGTPSRSGKRAPRWRPSAKGHNRRMDSRRKFIGAMATGLASTLASLLGRRARRERPRACRHHRRRAARHGTGSSGAGLPQRGDRRVRRRVQQALG